ncbi:MAG: hypothetical protein GC138_00850 [Gammaproteobacteria bacterium]|nr:hypothetical protein [Gammaproteobacteria bacterium]
MNIKLMSKKLTMAASAACLMAGMSVAQATPVTVYFDDNAGATASCADGAACDIANSLGAGVQDGVVTYNGAVGSWTVSVTTGVSYPSIGSPDHARLHMNNVSVSGGAGTLTLKTTDTGYTGPLSGTTFSGGYSVSASLQGTGVFDYYVDANNNAGDIFGDTTGAGVTHLGTLASGAGVYAASGGSSANNITGPFALTIVANITHANNGQVSSFDADIPEPSVLALAGLGMVALGLVGLGGRRRASVAA